MIKDLLIISPTKAKEINPYKITESWHYKRAEKYLKEYTITGVMVDEVERAMLTMFGELEFEYKYVGQKVKCKVNEETGEAVIL